MKKLILILLLLPILAYASTYVLDPNTNYVDEVGYNAKLNLIVIHVHAKVLWFSIDDFYGLKVVDSKDIDSHLLRMLGPSPQIVHINKIHE